MISITIAYVVMCVCVARVPEDEDDIDRRDRDTRSGVHSNAHALDISGDDRSSQ